MKKSAGIVLVLAMLLVSSCAAKYPGAASAPTSVQAQEDEPPRPPLPEGPGPVLGAQMTYEKWLEELKRLGVDEEYIVTQDNQRIDVQQDLKFSSVGDVEDLYLANLTYGNVVDNNLVVVEYEGDDCVVPVGGRTSIEAGRVNVEVQAGRIKGKTDCLGRVYYYRATFYVEGAREGATVTSSGSELKEGVMLPLKRDLPNMVIWPDQLPGIA